MTTEERAMRKLVRYLKNHEPEAALRVVRFFQREDVPSPSAVRILERIAAAPVETTP